MNKKSIGLMSGHQASLMAGLMAVLMLVTGCATASAGADLMKEIQPAQKPAQTTPAPAAYFDAMADFGWNLLKASAANEGSLMVSPASVHLALAMTLNGADTATRKQMLELLAGKGPTLDELNRAARSAASLWNDPSGKEKLTIANSIWFDLAFQPDADFLQVNADHYTAAARKIDFRKKEALTAINGWVKEATNGVIPTILDEIPEDAVMYLVNAIHFKAEWTVPFVAAETVKGSFHAPTGDVEALFMNRTGHMQYLNGDGMEGVLLPYNGGRFAYFALLPDEGTTPRALLDKLSNEDLQGFLKTLQTNKANFTVSLALPKFESEYKDSLKDELTAMGMGIAFEDSRADFSRMNEQRLRNLYIGDVLHKTFCRIDEKGTEAAAVTAVEIRLTSMPSSGVTLRLDRPFIYGIVDLAASVPMFVGIQENPAE